MVVLQLFRKWIDALLTQMVILKSATCKTARFSKQFLHDIREIQH